MWTEELVTCCVPECFGLMHFPAPHPSSLTLLSLHPSALQQADVEPLLRVLVPDVLPGSQHLQRVPRCLDVTRWAHCSLVLHHLRGQPGEKSEELRVRVPHWGFSQGCNWKITSGSESLLWHLGAEDGIKVVIYCHLVGNRKLLHLAVKLGKCFVFQGHHFLYLLLCNCDGRFWQSTHWGGTTWGQIMWSRIHSFIRLEIKPVKI